MKNIITLKSDTINTDSLHCAQGDFLLCREGVSAAFPEALRAESVTLEVRAKASKKRGERKIVIVDEWTAKVGRKKFCITSKRADGMRGIAGANTFFVSLKK